MNLRALARFYYEIPRRFTAGLMPPVRNATIELTYRCNLRCEQCFIFNEEGEFGLDHKGRADLTTGEVLALVNQRLRTVGMRQINEYIPIQFEFQYTKVIVAA